MAITTYTAYSDVRAVLGVSQNELSDATLGLSVYELNLKAEFRLIGSGIPALFATVSSAVEAGTATDAEVVFYETTQLFSTYAVAKQLGSSLPLFSPKEMSDGQSMMQRFGVNPYQTTLDKVAEMYNRARDSLASAYATLDNSSTSSTLRTYMRVSTPSSDPVTG